MSTIHNAAATDWRESNRTVNFSPPDRTLRRSPYDVAARHTLDEPLHLKNGQRCECLRGRHSAFRENLVDGYWIGRYVVEYRLLLFAQREFTWRVKRLGFACRHIA